MKQQPQHRNVQIMSQTKLLEGIKVESVFHPSDFSEASQVAFVHALKIAPQAAKAELNLLLVSRVPMLIGRIFPASERRWSDGS